MMLEEYERKRRQQVSSMRSIKDYSMGIIFILLGVFFFLRENIPSAIDDYLRPPDMVDKILGVFLFIYGVWRVYRGYKKNYFR